jgi:hypothetical protein
MFLEWRGTGGSTPGRSLAIRSNGQTNDPMAATIAQPSAFV